jgi:hypothetical protein
MSKELLTAHAVAGGATAAVLCTLSFAVAQNPWLRFGLAILVGANVFLSVLNYLLFAWGRRP